MVPKRDLVSSLEAVLQGRRLHATSLGMICAEDLRAELQSFELGISASGTTRTKRPPVGTTT